MNCEYCNNPLPPNVLQCPSCGAPAPQAPPPQPASQPASQPPLLQNMLSGANQSSSGSNRTRFIYIILGVFLGYLGIHNFYVGRYGRGIAQLLITICFAWTGLGVIITWVWALIDICAITTDGEGRKFS